MLKRLPVMDVEGPPLVDTGQWYLKVGGLVKNPATVSVDEIKRTAPVEETFPIICVEGWDTWVRWTGIRLRDLMEIVQPLPEAKYLTFQAYSEYFDSLSMEDAMDDRTMLVWGLDGVDLPLEHGGPLRLVVPFKLAYKSVKWVNRITFTDSEELGYWEVRGYPAEAGIADEKRMEYGL